MQLKIPMAPENVEARREVLEVVRRHAPIHTTLTKYTYLLIILPPTYAEEVTNALEQFGYAFELWDEK